MKNGGHRSNEIRYGLVPHGLYILQNSVQVTAIINIAWLAAQEPPITPEQFVYYLTVANVDDISADVLGLVHEEHSDRAQFERDLQSVARNLIDSGVIFYPDWSPNHYVTQLPQHILIQVVDYHAEHGVPSQ